MVCALLLISGQPIKNPLGMAPLVMKGPHRINRAVCAPVDYDLHRPFLLQKAKLRPPGFALHVCFAFVHWNYKPLLTH